MVQDSRNYALDEDEGALSDVSFTVTVSGGLHRLLNRLAIVTDSDVGHVLLRAIALYKVAVQAELAGQRVAILDGDDEIEQEITGICGESGEAVTL